MAAFWNHGNSLKETKRSLFSINSQKPCFEMFVTSTNTKSPVAGLAAAVGYRHYVEELVRCSVYDREWETPEDEMTQVIVDWGAQFRMFKQDPDDAIDLVAEVVAEPDSPDS